MRKQTFFGRIESHLKDKYSGRLMSLILAEIAKQEPKFFFRLLQAINKGKLISDKSITPQLKGNYEVEVEWKFPNGRRADLAVLIDAKPIIIFEVKVDDLKSDGNPAQLADYINWVACDPGCLFVHVSRYFSQSLSDELARAESSGRIISLRYRNLHDVAQQFAQEGRSPLAAMLVEFLEEMGVTNYEKVDLETESKALTFLVTQVSGFPHFTGMGRLQDRTTTDLSAQLLARLINNMKAIGEWLFESDSKSFSQKPQTRFKGGVGFLRSDVARQVKRESTEDSEEQIIRIDDRSVAQGWITVFTRASVRRKNDDPRWTYVEFGFEVMVNREAGARATVRPYAAIYWNGGYEEAFGGPYADFPIADEAEKDFANLFRKVHLMVRAEGYKSRQLASIAEQLT